MNRTEEALAAYAAAHALAPKSALPLINRGGLWLSRGQPDRAMPDFELAVRNEPASVLAHLGLAATLLTKEDLEPCVNAASRVLTLDPKEFSALQYRGVAYAKLGKDELAIADLTRYLEVLAGYKRSHRLLTQPAGPAVGHRYRGISHLALGHLKEARADLDRAIELEPDHPDTHALHGARGTLNAREGKLEEALLDFTLAIRHGNDLRETWLGRGQCLAHKKDHAGAIADFDQVLKKSPDDSVARLLRGLSLDATKAYPLAAADYERACQEPKVALRAHNALGWLLATCPQDGVRNGEKALVHATHACELTGHKDPNCLTVLACAHAELGHYPEARSWQEKALALPGLAAEHVEQGKVRLALFAAGKPFRDTD